MSKDRKLGFELLQGLGNFNHNLKVLGSSEG